MMPAKALQRKSFNLFRKNEESQILSADSSMKIVKDMLRLAGLGFADCLQSTSLLFLSQV